MPHRMLKSGQWNILKRRSTLGSSGQLFNFFQELEGGGYYLNMVRKRMGQEKGGRA